MNSLILALSLVLGTQGVSETVPKEANEKEYSVIKSTNLLTDDEMLGQKGVALFTKFLTTSSLYALLLALDSEDPGVARSLKYVAALHEVHAANETLKQILMELQKNNQLLIKQYSNKGSVVDA